MTENTKKIFEILGVEPNEKFKLESDATNTIYYITEDLNFIGINKNVEYNFDDCFRLLLINKIGNIVKLPKEPKKKKLRDLTIKEAKEMQDKICDVIIGCKDCPFYDCCINDCIDLDQEIEIEVEK